MCNSSEAPFNAVPSAIASTSYPPRRSRLPTRRPSHPIITSDQQRGWVHDRVGYLGRSDELIAQVLREIRKGQHVVLTGAVGLGKSAVIQAALKQIELRPSEGHAFDPALDDTEEPRATQPWGSGLRGGASARKGAQPAHRWSHPRLPGSRLQPLDGRDSSR
jgi:hypothetical protein